MIVRQGPSLRKNDPPMKLTLREKVALFKLALTIAAIIYFVLLAWLKF